jgi:hypothetical protein
MLDIINFLFKNYKQPINLLINAAIFINVLTSAFLKRFSFGLSMSNTPKILLFLKSGITTSD